MHWVGLLKAIELILYSRNETVLHGLGRCLGVSRMIWRFSHPSVPVYSKWLVSWLLRSQSHIRTWAPRWARWGQCRKTRLVRCLLCHQSPAIYFQSSHLVWIESFLRCDLPLFYVALADYDCARHYELHHSMWKLEFVNTSSLYIHSRYSSFRMKLHLQ